MPPRSRVRVAEAFPVVCGIAMSLIHSGLLAMAIWVLMCFGLYLRPSELMKLRRGDIVAPQPSVSKYWTFLINPSAFLEKSKTGEMDESTVWDVGGLQWLNCVFQYLSTGGKNDDLVFSVFLPAVARGHPFRCPTAPGSGGALPLSALRAVVGRFEWPPQSGADSEEDEGEDAAHGSPV